MACTSAACITVADAASMDVGSTRSEVRFPRITAAATAAPAVAIPPFTAQSGTAAAGARRPAPNRRR